MGIQFVKPEKREESSMFTLKEATYVSYDKSRVVDFKTHKGGCVFLGPAGYQIESALAVKLGLWPGEKKEAPAAAPEPEKKEEPKPKGKLTAEQRIEQLEATIERIRRDAGLQKTREAESSTAKPTDTQPNPLEAVPFDKDKWQRDNPAKSYRAGRVE